MKQSSTLKVGICCINYHQKQLTLNCLATLKKQTYKNFTVYLLDNDSSGEFTSADLKKFPFVKYQTSVPNTGFAGGNNILMKQAVQDKCQLIILLNNDTEVTPDFISTFVATHQQHQPNDLIGCIITYLAAPQKIWFYQGKERFGLYITQHTFMDRSLDHVPHNTPSHYSDWITGCALGISASLIRKIGYLDESFFAYLEDYDYCLRARAVGGKCVVIPKPLVKHAVSPAVGKQGTNVFTEGRIKFQARNSVLLIKKHAKAWVTPLIYLNALCQISIYIATGRLKLSQVPLFLSITRRSM